MFDHFTICKQVFCLLILYLELILFFNTFSNRKWSKCDYGHWSLASCAELKLIKHPAPPTTDIKSIFECNLLSLMVTTSAPW